jgi:hypothetical protein
LTVGGILALVACGGGDDAAEAPTEPPTSPITSPTATSTPAATSSASTPDRGSNAAAVPEALDFAAPLVGGGQIEMGEFAGRPVLLWFWAPW